MLGEYSVFTDEAHGQYIGNNHGSFSDIGASTPIFLDKNLPYEICNLL